MLTREFLKEGKLQELVRAGDPSIHVLTDDELAASRRAVLNDLPAGQDVWVFAYGSLIWNPAFHFAESCLGTIYGYHRSFCLWVYLGRGTRENPGLMLGLRPGGATRGLVYRVAPDAIEEELTIIWRREMVTAAYVPRWVKVRTERGIVDAIAFVIDLQHERHADGLETDRIAEILAHARGKIGSSADYLFSTVDHLHTLGIQDRNLTYLADRVRAKKQNSADQG
ncbi:MAG: gamma-glutamylcyclotransferase [Pseudomonadota bacterium]